MRKQRVKESFGFASAMVLEKDRSLRKSARDVLSGNDLDMDFDDFLNGIYILFIFLVYLHIKFTAINSRSIKSCEVINVISIYIISI